MMCRFPLPSATLAVMAVMAASLRELTYVGDGADVNGIITALSLSVTKPVLQTVLSLKITPSSVVTEIPTKSQNGL